jgi:uncharacterized protein YrzB (UPF0473 family)
MGHWYAQNTAGFDLLFVEQSTRAICAIVQKGDEDLCHIWLEFEGISDFVCLEYQAIEVYETIGKSGKCVIVARTNGIDERYEIPVRVKQSSSGAA